jgi:PAS domain S-box-containing protein
MATAEMPFQPERINGRRELVKRCPQVIALLQAERQDEIFPLLLEGILALGYPRALVAGLNFDTGDITLASVLKWPSPQVKKFTTALWNSDHPLVGVLHANRPAVLTKTNLHNRPIYLHPILYSNQGHCREAEDVRAADCLASQNFRHENHTSREEQMCSVCGIRGFSAVVVVELPRNAAAEGLRQLGELIELANHSLYRLFKAEHYYSRARDMESTLAQLGTVRQDRDRLNLILENVGDAIVVCDSHGKIVLVDPLAQELLGSNSEGARSTVQGQNRAKFAGHIDSFIHSVAERQDSPLCAYHPGLQQVIEYDARSGKIFNERGQVSSVVTVLRDLTALRKVEQVKMERRMLEIEKFAATGRLAATIAHEVNNPMEAIKNAIYLLAGSVPENALPVYNILKSETERVARIVRQMLGLYRNTEQAKPANVNMIIEDTLLLLSRQLQRASVELQVDLRAIPDAVIAGDQIRQVISNLVINARDAMPTGGRLRIRSRHLPRHDGLHGWVRVLIADTGTGIPPEMLCSIYEPFVTTKGEKGTGLGLWIVRGIIQNHSGRLSVRSKVGCGTVFKIDLPVFKP